MACYRLEQTLLSLEDLNLRLGGRDILTGVNASIRNVTRPGVEQGQVVAILGPSGIGKTQLFRVLAGLQSPDSGRVLLGAEQRPVERGTVGVVAQDYPLFEHHSVLANLRLAARLAGLRGKEAEQRCRDLLARFRLEAQGDCYPAVLSGGQRQRAAIAQQLLRASRLLLLDEPFSGLDLRMVRETCALVREVSQQDELFTIVLVSHDIEAVLAVSDTVWLLGRSSNQPRDAGASIVHRLDLMERGLAWCPDVRDAPGYVETKRELERRFLEL
ncbi:MAG TPA: ATP-binding cassette domain-containing protein [Polyangiaceae bacterium]|nr:ATP-binding cassette domain-containing protein [Polyangiaceae bacterium]